MKIFNSICIIFTELLLLLFYDLVYLNFKFVIENIPFFAMINVIHKWLEAY